MQITNNFWLKEFLEGTNLPKKAIAMNDIEKLTPEQLIGIGVVAHQMQIIRDATKKEFGSDFGGFLIVAGVRQLEWELYKKRSGLSQHVNGWAVDFQPICEEAKYMLIFNWIFNKFEPIFKGGFAKKEPDLKGKEKKKGFIHIDMRLTGKARWSY